jgi:hypothetical protein
MIMFVSLLYSSTDFVSYCNVSLLKRSLLPEGVDCFGASGLGVSFVVPHGFLDVAHPHELHDWEVCSTLIIWRSRFFW